MAGEARFLSLIAWNAWLADIAITRPAQLNFWRDSEAKHDPLYVSGMQTLSAAIADDLWLRPNDWRGYEAYVVGVLVSRFPGARVTGNVRLKGRKSGRSRQVDILVDLPGVLAVDCKCYSRKVDVKHVESFLGMMDDLGVRAGVLVTTKGYSAAALARAENDDRQLQLQIVSPDRLSEYQHVGAPLFWRGTLGVSIEPPVGWVVDNELTNEPDGPLVTMYPLGHTISSASQLATFCYANILTKPSDGATLAEIAAPHQADTLIDEPSSSFEVGALRLTDRGGIERPALLRTATVGAKLFGQEHCLYVDFDQAVLLLVILSAPGEATEALAKLQAMAKSAFVMRVQDRRV